MTIVRDAQVGKQTEEQKNDHVIKYEITPFREESGYADNRHPDTIVRSNNLLSDAARRDFTINAMYYSKLKQRAKAKEELISGKEEEILKDVKVFGYSLVGDVLVIQDHQIISHLLE